MTLVAMTTIRLNLRNHPTCEPSRFVNSPAPSGMTPVGLTVDTPEPVSGQSTVVNSPDSSISARFIFCPPPPAVVAKAREKRIKVLHTK